jgi:hypothetical protein
MLFTERNYRALALLCRPIAEQYGIPRNFPVLPHLRVAEQTSSDYFRALLLTYQRSDLIATKLNLQIADVQANNATFTQRLPCRQIPRYSPLRQTRPSRHGRKKSHVRPLLWMEPAYERWRRHTMLSRLHLSRDRRKSFLPGTLLRLAPLCARGLGLVVVSVRLYSAGHRPHFSAADRSPSVQSGPSRHAAAGIFLRSPGVAGRLQRQEKRRRSLARRTPLPPAVGADLCHGERCYCCSAHGGQRQHSHTRISAGVSRSLPCHGQRPRELRSSTDGVLVVDNVPRKRRFHHRRNLGCESRLVEPISAPLVRD